MLEAEKHYLEALRILPNYISALNNLGMLYHSYIGKSDVALPYLQKAVKLDTAYVEAHYNLASCLSTLKRFEWLHYPLLS